MHSERRAEILDLIYDLLKPNGCLKCVLLNVLQKRGYSVTEISDAFLALEYEVTLVVSRFKHPVLMGATYFSVPALPEKETVDA